jgi:hypothetical protein
MRRSDIPGSDALNAELGELWDAIQRLSMSMQGVVAGEVIGSGEPGPQGPQGERGPAGAAGANGAPGADGEDASVDFGATPPPDPEVGDIWMDTTAPTFSFGLTPPADPKPGDIWFDTTP